VAGILEVAKQLAAFQTRNAVRFGFWSGEEEGLLGSTQYVNSLGAIDKAKIRLYLNFDMIASPNYVYGIHNADGTKFNASATVPQGSSDIEKFFQQFFVLNKLNHTSTPFDGRSDYQAFIEAGIPSGGIETGAEEVKTKKEEAEFGGKADLPLDANYHAPGDNYTNLNPTAFLVNSKAIAHAVATFGVSFRGINFNESRFEILESLHPEDDSEEEDEEDDDVESDIDGEKTNGTAQSLTSTTAIPRFMRLETTVMSSRGGDAVHRVRRLPMRSRKIWV
jgi:hypothetical protein